MATPIEKRRRERLEDEIGTIRKRWQNRVRVALVYPNHYHVGMANLGFQTVYQTLNRLPHLVCERVFLPDAQTPGTPVASLESGRQLGEFDCVAFSLSFENDYPNVLTLLQRAALPLRSAHRGASLPLVFAGGVAVFLNPEPLAPFFDCLLIGEAEPLLLPFFEYFDPTLDRYAMLVEMARNLPGVYVPSFYKEKYRNDGTLEAFLPTVDVPETIERVYASDFAGEAVQSAVLSPHTGFADAHLIEVSRGCPHGCRFCAAGYLYRPPRTRPLPALLQAMEQGAAHTSKIGLVGTAVSDLPDLKALCHEGRSRDLQMAFSSLRADALDETLVAALKAGRLKTATIAPETGSERLRLVINKGLTEQDILNATEKLVSGGIPNLKLYFMVGLPTETDEDIEAIVTLVKKIKRCFLRSSKKRGHMGVISVSLNCFVPKPFTPFQWVAMDTVSILKKKIKKIKYGLKQTSNVNVQADVPRWAYIQALLARGDRRVGQLLLMAHTNQGNWPQTIKASPIDVDFYVQRQRDVDELLPWDFIDHGVGKDFLQREYRRAMKEKMTKPCPMDPLNCNVCGACGPLAPRTATSKETTE